jgi:hypothetical protein
MPLPLTYLRLALALFFCWYVGRAGWRLIRRGIWTNRARGVLYLLLALLCAFISLTASNLTDNGYDAQGRVKLEPLPRSNAE